MEFLKTDSSIEKAKDVVGGGSLIWDTGVYDVTIDSAYLDQSDGGAFSVNFTFKTPEGRELRSTQYVTTNTKKGTKNYYEKNGKKFYLPGFNITNEIAKITLGKEIGELVPEDKIIELYDYNLKKKVPVSKPVYMELRGQSIKICVVKAKEYKKVQDDSGNYVPINEIRELNEVAKALSIDGLTSLEVEAGQTEPDYKNKWEEKHGSDFIKDKTRNVKPIDTNSNKQETAGNQPPLFPQ